MSFDSVELVELRAKAKALNNYTVDSDTITEKFRLGADAIRKQVSRNREAFEEFGTLRTHSPESTGGRQRIIYEFNYDQFCLLVAFLDTTEYTKPAKIELVKRYSSARRQAVRLMDMASKLEADEAYLRGSAGASLEVYGILNSWRNEYIDAEEAISRISSIV